MQDVANLAGVAKATVYRNYATKEALFEAVAKSRAVSNRGSYPSERSEGLPLEPAMVNLAADFLSDIYSTEQIEIFRAIVIDARTLPALGQLMIDQAFVETRSRIVRFMVERMHLGEIQGESGEDLAEHFISLIKSYKHVPLVFGQDVDTSTDSIRKVAQRAVKIFLYGVAIR